MTRPGVLLGFACAWEPDPRRTWSGAPWALRAALRQQVRLHDLDASPPSIVRTALRAAYARRRQGVWTTEWQRRAPTLRLAERRVRAAVRRSTWDAVLQMGDLAATDVPTFHYQDLSYDIVLDHAGGHLGPAPMFPGLSLRELRRRRDRQHRVYGRAAGVIAMSAWFARSLVERTGLTPDHVHVVNPGANLGNGQGPLLGEDESARLVSEPVRLLFVGIDFHRKGGDQVMAAVPRLRREFGGELTVTVGGPRTWPLPGPVPDGVRFVGRVPAAQMPALYRAHDVLVLPSRFEAFGMAFVEALAHGLPCIGRDAFAMPELISPGVNGELVRSDDPDELVDAVARIVAQPEIAARCRQQAPAVRAHASWDRAAAEILEVIDATLDRA